MKIVLKKNDIKYGKRGSTSSCAIARRVGLMFGKDSIPSVGLRITVKKPLAGGTQATWVYDIPDKCQNFIDTFDEKTNPKAKIKPISFIAQRYFSAT